MKRFLIFTVLFPPLALLVFIATEWRGELLPIGLIFFMLGYAYLIAAIPAWLTGGGGLGAFRKAVLSPTCRDDSCSRHLGRADRALPRPGHPRRGPGHWVGRRNSSRNVLVAVERKAKWEGSMSGKAASHRPDTALG